MSELLFIEEGRAKLHWACSFMDSPEVHHCRKWRPYETEACEVVANPFKLAEVMSKEGIRLGLEVVWLGDYFATHPQKCPHNKIGIFCVASRRQIVIQFGFPQRWIDLRTARKILAAWIVLPDKAETEAHRILVHT